MAWAIYDLDYGLANSDVIRSRSHATFGPIKTEWFKDAPIKANSSVISNLRKSRSNGDKIVVLTSRFATKESKELTLKWLRSFSIPFDKVIFRRPNDMQPDKLYKPWALIKEGLMGQNVTKIVSSQKEMVSYYRRIGIKQEVA